MLTNGGKPCGGKMTLYGFGRIALLFVIVVLTAPSLAQTNEGVNDPKFDVLSQRIPGFRRIVNTPPVPETKFLNAENESITLKEFAGKALLVNFWATWCPPCLREMPDLNNLSAELGGKDFEVVAIATGRQVGKPPDVFLKENKLDALDLYQDPHTNLMSLFETQTLPTTLIVDKNGRIRGGVMGAINWNSDEVKAVLAHLMNE